VNKQKTITFSISIAIGLILWFIPAPSSLKPEAWHLFAIFSATIVGIILKPFPMGVIAILALTVSILTKTLTFADAFSGFSNEVVWLVVFAFFISRAFISCGLGNRIAFWIMSLIGKNSLGLGYGLVATDFIMAPLIPSLTARGGGVIYPLVKSVADIFTGNSHDPKMGAFLTLAAFQGMAVTSAMFLTSMAGNPLIAEFAKTHGIELTWVGWISASIVPGLISLCVIPYLIYWLVSPTIRKTPHARDMAKAKLDVMGPMKPKEWIVLGTFVLLIFLWVVGNFIGLKATAAAMVGLSILLLTGILRFKDILEEHSAWDTFIWFATLVTIPSFLNKFGFSAWFGDWIVMLVSGFEWIAGFIVIALIYFYSHYLFASNVGHITALFAPFLIVAIALGTPPELAALVLGFFSSLFGGLTHYGSGPAPILFGTGYVSIGEWWKVGAIVGLANVIIWMLAGGLWWKILGLW
jgi:divalent anion:Na+ symporter, DASS family